MFKLSFKKVAIVLFLTMTANLFADETNSEQTLKSLEILRDYALKSKDNRKYLDNELKIDKLNGDIDRDRFLNNKYHLAMAYYYNNRIKSSIQILEEYHNDYMETENMDLKLKYLSYGSAIYYNYNPSNSKWDEMLNEVITSVSTTQVEYLKYLVTADWAKVKINYPANKQISEKHCERILNYLDTVPEDGEFNSIFYYDNIIQFYFAINKEKTALKLIEDYINKFKQVAEKNPYTINMYLLLGNYWGRKDSDKSFNYYKEAETLAIDTEFTGSETPGVISYSLALYYENLGDTSNAYKYYEKAYDQYEKAYNDLYPDGLLNQQQRILRIAQYKDDCARKLNSLGK